MDQHLFIGLINNAALLLALGLLYDVLILRWEPNRRWRRHIAAGLVLGLMGMVVMLNAIPLGEGIFFDTRSIVLSVAGLFFGTVPTVMTMAMTGGLRIYQGGDGMVTGLAVIGCSGALGIAWRAWRLRDIARLSLTELYFFGIVVHLAVLACLMLLPVEQRGAVARQIWWPVLLIYPAAAALLGRLMVHRHAIRNAAQEVENTNALVRTVIDNIPLTVYVKDSQGRTLMANRADIARTGRPEPAVIGMTGEEASPPGHAAQCRETDRRVMAQGEPVFDIDEVRVEADGATRWIRTSKLPLRDADGAVTGLVEIGQDITALKREEERFQHTVAIQQALGGMATKLLAQTDYDAALQTLLAELGALTGACRTYYFVMDEAAGVVDNSHEWCSEGVPSVQSVLRRVPFSAFPWSIERIRRGEVIHLNNIEELPPEAGEERENLAAMNIKSLLIFPIFVGTDCAAFLGLSAVCATRVWDTEEVLLLGLFASTLSAYIERQAAEVEHIHLERQVLQAQKLESLGVLAGGIAHDFNNILMAILGHADLALDGLAPLSPARESIQEIERAARRAAELCRQMLAYSGKGRFIIERIDLGELVEEMVHMLRTTVSKNAQINLNLEKNLPCMEGDATQMRQVIMNLVINASEAIGERNGVITISTGSMYCTAEYLVETYLEEDLTQGLYVTLEVSDTGCGMDRETQDRIFEPFFTTKFTGRGLGMAAVLGIMRGHKGALKVYSEPGKGTTFKMLLPAVEESVEKRLQPTDETAAWLSDGTVLLVDDEETIRALGKRMLERLGFKVLTAADGHEAVSIYKEHGKAICVVLLDLTMPHMNGEEAFRVLRSVDPAVRVILSSGYTQHDVIGRFAGKGLAGFIAKPYTLSALRDVLRTVLEPNEESQGHPAS